MKTTKIILSTSIAILFFACGKKNGEYDASGVFETTEVIVSSEATGKILSFGIEEGQTVEAGKEIGCIDTTQLFLKKKQLSANIKSANTRRTDIPLQIAALKEQIETQKREQKRYENLVKSNAANQKQLDDINSQLYVLQKQLAAQVDAFQNANNGISEESAGLDVQIAQIDDQITKSIIVSPIKGTVLAKYTEMGELAVPGKALFKVADVNNMFLRAYITSNQLTDVKIGQKVTVFADFGDRDSRSYEGTVSWISDKAEFTPKTIQTRDERANLVYAVKISVKNDGYIKQGMYGEVKFGKTE